MAALASHLVLPLMGPSARAQSHACRVARATAESEAFLLVSPTVWVEGVHVPRLGDETGMGLISGGEYQLRAALSWSPTDLARGLVLLDQAAAECRAIDAATRVQRVLRVGDGLGELEARRAEHRVLTDARAEVDALVAHAEDRVAAGVGTRHQLASVRSEALRIARRRAALDVELARLEAAGHDEADWRGFSTDVAEYESSARAVARARSTFRRVAPWTVSLRGGVVPAQRVDWFGQIQLGVNLGVFAQHAAEEALLDASDEQLTADEAGLGHQARILLERLRAGLPGLREQLAHSQSLLALQLEQERLLAELESAEVELTRALTTLVAVGLRAEEAYLATLVAIRDAVLAPNEEETRSHADR